jgi:hypothetical protein
MVIKMKKKKLTKEKKERIFKETKDYGVYPKEKSFRNTNLMSGNKEIDLEDDLLKPLNEAIRYNLRNIKRKKREKEWWY